MPETFDLERALDDLTRDVASRSHPAGADRAVSTARRRRSALATVAAHRLSEVIWRRVFNEDPPE